MMYSAIVVWVAEQTSDRTKGTRGARNQHVASLPVVSNTHNSSTRY
jgi:hypothetical protein